MWQTTWSWGHHSQMSGLSERKGLLRSFFLNLCLNLLCVGCLCDQNAREKQCRIKCVRSCSFCWTWSRGALNKHTYCYDRSFCSLCTAFKEHSVNAALVTLLILSSTSCAACCHLALIRHNVEAGVKSTAALSTKGSSRGRITELINQISVAHSWIKLNKHRRKWKRNLHRKNSSERSSEWNPFSFAPVWTAGAELHPPLESMSPLD